MNKKSSVFLLFLCLTFLVAYSAYAATVTIHFPAANSIQNAAIAGDGNNITINVSVSVTVNDGNVSALNLSYRATSSGAWSSIGDNTTFNLTQEAGNHTYTFPWNISSLTDGTTYELNATAVNDTNIIGDTTVTGITLDHTNPAVTLETLDPVTEKSKTNVFFSDKVLLRCKRSDATAGFNDTNISITLPDSTTVSLVTKSTSTGTASTTLEDTFKDTNKLGKFVVSCSAIDQAGNTNFTTNATFEVVVKPPTGSTRPKGFVNPVGKKIISETADLGRLTTEKAISVQLRKAATVKIDVEGTSYDFSLKELSETSIKMMAGASEIEVNQGESVEVDLDNDGTNDVKVTYHKQFKEGTRATADVTFEAVTTLVKETGKAPGEAEREVTREPARASTAGSLIVTIIVIVVIVIIGYFLIKGKKK